MRTHNLSYNSSQVHAWETPVRGGTSPAIKFINERKSSLAMAGELSMHYGKLTFFRK